MIYYNDEYFDDITDIIERYDLEDEIINHGLEIEIQYCEKQTMWHFDAEYMASSIPDDQFSEDATEYKQIVKMLCENIDFDKINELMPKLWYPVQPKKLIKVTNAELLEAL